MSAFTDGGDIDDSNSSNRKQQNTSSAEVKKIDTNFYGTRCKSTCNIIVTAVADFLSPSDIQTFNSGTVQNDAKDSETFVFNTSANCTLLHPEKVCIFNLA